MYYFTSSLLAYNINATDGEMGKIKDLYMDENWNVRYVIVDTRKWLPERKVLLPPSAFSGIHEEDETVDVEYDKSTVKDSPTVPENTDLTRDKENQLINYFGWYRDDVLISAEQRPLGLFRGQEEAERHRYSDELMEEEDRLLEHRDNNLRSHQELIGARVHAKDGKIGKIIDFIRDDTWNIKYIVLTSTDLQVQDHYRYPVEQITSIDWYEGDVYLDETMKSFENKRDFPKKEDMLHTLP